MGHLRSHLESLSTLELATNWNQEHLTPAPSHISRAGWATVKHLRKQDENGKPKICMLHSQQ